MSNKNNETLKSLLIKIDNKEVSMNDAVDYAVNNIPLTKLNYTSDGVFASVVNENGSSTATYDPENTPEVLSSGVDVDYSAETYHDFVSSYIKGCLEK